jgi:type IV pilus assembly protein PilM
MEPSRLPTPKSDSQPFNPYHKWLGIRDSQSPPNHYRLLGLELWETDEDVIREAYSRQMNHVRQFWIGPHRDLCQQILDELLAARDTLIDAQLRRPYDRWLKLVRSETGPQTAATNSAPRQPFAVHSAPVTAVVGTPPADVNCPRCGIENASSRKFCAGCGESLWEPCIECGVPCSPSDAHCGNCGVNLPEAIQRRLQGFQNLLDQATQLQKEKKFDEAIEVLEEGMLHEHPRLVGYHNRAEQLIAGLKVEIHRLVNAANTALADGQQLLDAGEFERAALIFEELPDRLRTAPMRQLLDLIRTRQVEALTLASEVRQILSEKRYAELKSKVEQLLLLQPNHAEARQLNEKLNALESKKIKAQRVQLCNLAQAAIQKRDYAKAAAFLQQIPLDYRTTEISQTLEKVSLRAEEINWLKRDLRGAVIYDEHLLPLAERLLKLQPDEPLAKKCIDLLQKRENLGLDEQADQKSNWPCFPAKERAKLSVALPKKYQRIDIEQSQSEVIANSGRFCVAIGLALQGLEQSALKVNLAMLEERGFLDILKSKRNITAAWGIDLGRTALKAVKLEPQPSSERLLISESFLISNGCPVDATPEEIELKAQQGLASFLESANLDECAICINLPAEKVIQRLVSIPAGGQERIDDIMEYEIKQQIPLPLETIAYDYEVLAVPDRPDAEDLTTEPRVAIVGAKFEDLQVRLSALTERDIRADIVQSDCAALYNFLAFEFDQMLQSAELAEGSRPVLAMCDVGSISSNLVITDGTVPFMRSIHLGGNDFTRSLVKRYSLTWADAEKLKRSPTSAPFVHQMYEALEPSFQKLNAELQHSIDQYLQQDSRRELGHLVPIGEGWKLHGLLKHLCLGA